MTDPFRPLRFLGNPHVQTILANLWRGRQVQLPTRTHVVPLADGDALAAHDTVPPSWRGGEPIVILVHGLGGCHQSGYLQRLTNTFTARGLRAVRIDLRGAGAGAHLARRVYNAASADDVRAVAEFLLRDTPQSPLIVVGFSLGGNIVLNVAADAAVHPLPALCGVVAVSPAADLVLCSEMLAKLPFYDHYYARNLRMQVKCHEAHFPNLKPSTFPRRLTMRLFDDIYTAPRGGFADAMDYYRRASSAPVLHRIHVPTYVLSARDDPFIAVGPLENLGANSNLEVQLVAQGGHLGFLGRDGAGGLRWGERRVAEWVRLRLGKTPC